MRTWRMLAALVLVLELVGLSARGLAADIRVGAVYSTAQSSSQSFLRFFNTGANAGTVTVTLQDQASGQTLGQWTSPSIPAGAEHQFALSTVEAGAGNFAKPNYYAVTVRTSLSGYFQHVLFRPGDGTLTNLSTCSSGITTDLANLSGVHSSLLSVGYASSIVVNNTGAAAAAATLGLYDARDGTKVGVANFAPVAPGGQTVLSIQEIEAAANFTPTGGLLHYVVKLEGAFTGYLQHLLTNVQAGVVTDMTTACTLDGVASAVAQATLRTGAVFSTAQSESQSFLRFFNAGTSSGTVTVTLNDQTTGAALGEWTSPSIPPASEQQFAIGTIETGTGQTFVKPNYYGVRVQPGIAGYFQHVLWRAADGTLTNLSTCAAGVTANASKLSGVHSSLLSTGYASTVVVHNTGVPAAVTLGVYDARDGSKRGTYTTPEIPSGGQALVSVEQIEASVGAPAAGMYHYVIEAEAPFNGFLQHLVNNSKAGVVTDMTTSCAIALEQSVVASAFTATASFGGPCQPGQTGMVGFLMICASDGRFRYALPDDMPATPAGGYTERPAWYPPLRNVFQTSNPPSCPASGRIATMNTFIVPLDQLALSTPQGAMLGDHVTPIDHGYIGLKAMDKPQAARTEADYVPVYAPADGEIIDLSSLGAPWTNRVVIAHGCDTYSVIMVMNRLAGVLASYQTELMATGRVSTKIAVRAGDVIGEQRDNPLDYSINDGSAWLSGYVSPYSYAQGEAWKPYTVDPLPYFTPAISSAVTAVMRRAAAPRWGKIDYDVAGTASGSWFLLDTAGYSGLPLSTLTSATAPIPGGQVAGKNTVAWNHLSLSPYWNEPSQWVFSTGWWRDEKGDPQQWHLDTSGGKPAPSALTPSSGTVVYHLRQLVDFSVIPAGGNTQIAGIVAIKVNADETLTIEPIPGVEDPAAFTGFSSAKRTYRR